MGPYLRPDVPTLCGDLLDTGVFAILPFNLCTQCLWVQPPPISAGCPVPLTCSVDSHIITMSTNFLCQTNGSVDSVTLDHAVNVVFPDENQHPHLAVRQFAVLSQAGNGSRRNPKVSRRIALCEPQLVDTGLRLGDCDGMVKLPHSLLSLYRDSSDQQHTLRLIVDRLVASHAVGQRAVTLTPRKAGLRP